jgi:hypothetical protein
MRSWLGSGQCWLDLTAGARSECLFSLVLKLNGFVEVLNWYELKMLNCGILLRRCRRSRCLASVFRATNQISGEPHQCNLYIRQHLLVSIHFVFVFKTLSLQFLTLSMSFPLPFQPSHIVDNAGLLLIWNATTRDGCSATNHDFQSNWETAILPQAETAFIPFSEPRASASPWDLLLIRTNPVTLPFSPSCSMLKLANASSPMKMNH